MELAIWDFVLHFVCNLFWLDMTKKKAGRVNRFAGQRVTGQKIVILSWIKSYGSGWVRLTRIFHMNFIFYFYKKEHVFPI